MLGFSRRLNQEYTLAAHLRVDLLVGLRALVEPPTIGKYPIDGDTAFGGEAGALISAHNGRFLEVEPDIVYESTSLDAGASAGQVLMLGGIF